MRLPRLPPLLLHPPPSLVDDLLNPAKSVFLYFSCFPFREGAGSEKERDRNVDVGERHGLVASQRSSTREGNAGMCPDRERSSDLPVLKSALSPLSCSSGASPANPSPRLLTGLREQRRVWAQSPASCNNAAAGIHLLKVSRVVCAW